MGSLRTNGFEKLSTPFKIGSTDLKNRVVMTPLTRGRATKSGQANQLMAEYYSQRAGAGLIVSEGVQVSKQGEGWFRAPCMYTESHALSWRQVTQAIHSKGGKIFAQLWHTGRASHSSFRANDPQFPRDLSYGVAPSAIKKRSESGTQMFSMLPGAVPIETPRELRNREVKDVVCQFSNAAKMAKLAGFDGIEIHAAAGYLIDEFLQTCSNKRRDEYGGSPENRFRLLREILNGVQRAYNIDCIGVRLSPNGSYNGMGSETNFEDFSYFAKQLDAIGVAYLHIVDGITFQLNPFHGLGTLMTLRHFRDLYSGTIIGNAGYDGPSAEKVVCDGDADAISFGRLYISNPDLAERFQNGWELNEMPPWEIYFSTADKILAEDGYTTFQHYSK